MGAQRSAIPSQLSVASYYRQATGLRDSTVAAVRRSPDGTVAADWSSLFALNLRSVQYPASYLGMIPESRHVRSSLLVVSNGI